MERPCAVPEPACSLRGRPMIAEASTRVRARGLVAAMAAITIAGAGVSLWRARLTDRWMREDLLLQTRVIAQAIDPQALAALSGSETDLEAPRYLRLKEQLARARDLYPKCRFLYLTGLRPDGTIFFYMDSEPPDSEDYSPPGQSYEEATPVFEAVFKGGGATTEGPVADRWGTWVSAFVPLVDSRNGRVLAVLGMDEDAAQWTSLLWGCARRFVLLTLAMNLVAIGGFLLLKRRAGLMPDRHGRLLRHAEVVIVSAMGMCFAWGWAGVLHDSERRVTWKSFCQLAASEINGVLHAVDRIRHDQLEGLARFLEGSQPVDRNEFHQFAGFLDRNMAAQAWAWVPRVPDAERSAFERTLREGGSPGFRIWQREADGGSAPASGRDAYYPVCYVEPPECPQVAPGFDLGSDTQCRAPLEEASRTGLATVSEPAAGTQGMSSDVVVSVFRPVMDASRPDRISGFALVMLRVDVLVRNALAAVWADTPVELRMEQRRAGAPPIPLAVARSPTAGPAEMTFIAPVFAFGKTYGAICEPSEAFWSLHPPRAAWQTGIAGAALTAVLAAFVGFLRGRQATLERLVQARTSELRESEISYRGLFNSIRTAIFAQDRQGFFLDVNAAAVAMYGYSREEFIGRSSEFLSAPGRNDSAALSASVERAWEGGAQHFEFWGRGKDGREFPSDVSLCLGAYAGKPAVIVMASDGSDRKQAEAERARLQTQLQQAQKMESVGRLAGGVAHDFNNMLQAILGNSVLALDAAPEIGALREHIEEVQKSAGRAADLTRQLLAFASRQPIRPRVLDLNDTVAGMLKMLRRLIGEDIHLLWSPGANVGPVNMDPSQIDQILANLAVNARDAIDGVGRVTIETSRMTCKGAEFCSLHPDGHPGRDYVTLTVADNGRGMDAETRAHLFEPFFTTKPAGMGTGLGLATVFGIVKQNDGFIYVATEPGQGTTFRIFLPSAPLPVAAAPARARGAPRGGSETILLVEDEKSVLAFCRESLRRLGYTVLAANAPAEAIDRAREYAGDIDLLVTDVVLPQMNGRELALHLAALRPNLSFLFMSGYTADIIAHRGILDDDVNFIQKPFTIGAFAAKIREVLEEPAQV
jgi:PAS domain S-box-containing protein